MNCPKCDTEMKLKDVSVCPHCGQVWTEYVCPQCGEVSKILKEGGKDERK